MRQITPILARIGASVTAGRRGKVGVSILSYGLQGEDGDRKGSIKISYRGWANPWRDVGVRVAWLREDPRGVWGLWRSRATN